MKKRKIKKKKIIILFLILFCLCVVFPYKMYRTLTQSRMLDANSFVLKNGIMTYQDSNVPTMIGIDVSSFQGHINWEQVKKDGIDFVMIRCGFRDALTGKLYKDPMFETNIQEALSKDLHVGVYFFSSACTCEELLNEVDFVLKCIKSYSITMPVAYDMEFYQGNQGRILQLTSEQKTQFALMFSEKIEKAGYEVMIYGNENWLTEQLIYEDIQNVSIWYAAYRDIPNTKIQFDMWQYSDQGFVKGIQGPVDMNILFTDD